MPKTLINCPNCRQPMTADIEQLFDVGVNPQAKQQILSGSFNQIQCSVCGFQGMYPSVIVYHDPGKELLLTFTPPGMLMQRNDQERMIGNLINQAMKNLPPEQRKGYFLNPQSVLTMQGLVERVLEADGVTKEMLQAQQERLSLLQRLLTLTSEEARVETIHEQDALIDTTTLNMLRRLMEAAAMNGDQAAATELEGLQGLILRESTLGRELQTQAQEVEAALRDLQSAGQQLTREKLLDLAVKARSEEYLRALVNFARAGMDYQFFQLLSERIDRARSDGRARLVELRTTLLDWTREHDEQVAAHLQDVQKLLEAILNSEEISAATAQSLPFIDTYFLQELDNDLKTARQQGDLDKLAKLQKIVDVLEQASRSTPEIALVEQLLDVPEDQKQTERWLDILKENAEAVTPEFLSALGSIQAQVQESGDETTARRMMELNRLALRFSMQRNLQA